MYVSRVGNSYMETFNSPEEHYLDRIAVIDTGVTMYIPPLGL